MKLSLRSMGGKRSGTAYLNLEICTKFFVGFLLIYAARISLGATNPADVAAINSLYAAMGSPALPGWVGSAGDPCGEGWQGVVCNGSDIQSIVLNAANLGGELGETLGNFASIKSIDLSNNQIGGSIPSTLPVTMQNLFLSANQLSGSIPDSLSSLALLTDMSLNDNLLSGELPDAFQTLAELINLDLSNNNLSGELPPSLENLSRLTTLHLQENQLSGTLDVLQDLPLRDLNIENNLFAGPIPDKMQSIPIFRKDGNPFNNITIAPSLAPSSPVPSSPSTVPPRAPTPPGASSFWHPPGRHADSPTTSEESDGGTNKFLTKKRVVWISIAGVILFIIMALGLALFMPSCMVRREEADGAFKRHRVGADGGHRENPRDNGSQAQSTNQMEKVPNVAVMPPKEGHQIENRRAEAAPKQQNEQERNVRRMSAVPKREDHSIDMSEYDMILMPPPPPPPPSPPPPPAPTEKVIMRPVVPAVVKSAKPSSKAPNIITSARSFTIAALQQYTNSFSQENLIGEGMLGNTYRAQLPHGKLLAVKKLDKRVSDQQKDDEFLELVNNIDRIRHANVVELVGYCAEHGQRLLIYEYCSNGTLQDALHSDDELRKKLSWNTRIQMALGAARALEYLHEICQPPVVHRNFKSVNVLLDDDLSIRVSDCGLAPLISKGSVSQLSGQLLSVYGYGAPEFESGIYTYQSDIYSFGVVMLELLTGRKSYDRTRNRGEQLLVGWAIPQLHDIDALSRMVDPYLNGEYTAKSLSHFADIISRCVQSEPEFRPPMSEVVQDLRDMIRRERPSNDSIGD